ncbi:glycoside hydrolase domain-containing protein [Sphingobacterium sp.]|uniref:glycoside hydrolase domain-containing protein n=1 Tax=Sphingobacterium sp. TaxID=341027 RepID=UPI0028A19C51|nr:glycoside hydrolase domain-containing protein [Sphingobacterium sp.]
MLYTNMHLALASRNTFSDVNGEWRTSYEVIRILSHKGDRTLSNDAFWNLNQFWNLITPEFSNKRVRSQLEMYDANGWLAKEPDGMK